MKNVFFDLDDTLYRVEQYYLGAFLEIAEYLSKKGKYSKEEIYEKLEKKWDEKNPMYPHFFDDLFEELNLEKDVKKCVEIFSNYSGKLVPYEETFEALNELKKKGIKLGMITDGNAERQKRKIDLLGIKDFFEVFVFTQELGEPKPSEIPFKIALEKTNAKGEKCIYVGDNPLIDFIGAKKTGMKTVRILKGKFCEVEKDNNIDYEIKNLKELINLI
jgi:putative hydrolase of the HAD superfamily